MSNWPLQDEVDLIFPVLDEEGEREELSVEQFQNIINIFD
jgi:hypothetical protein